jgi:predicted CoA-substrate-specific enzyme activase
MISVVCKYTPVELFAGFGQECTILDHMADNFDLSDSVAHVNLCGFGKTVIQTALEGKVDQLVLVNCCDVMRRSYEIVNGQGCCTFTHLMDLPHLDGPCQIDSLARSLKRLKSAYEKASGIPFDLKACQAAFTEPETAHEPYVGVLGVRVGFEMQQMIENLFSLPVRNLTCTGNRGLAMDPDALSTDDEDAFFKAYAQALLGQIPCMRMNIPQGRRRLFEDPNLRGIIYHSMKFCDFYEPEYAQVAAQATVPVLKLESDFTLQSKEQLRTRIEAFAETLQPARKETHMERPAGNPTGNGRYVAGIDSGSTSTDVVILNPDGTIRASSIIPTGSGAQQSAEASLKIALDEAGLAESEIRNIITTGYGRAYLDTGDDSITEITCHAKGAHFLNPQVRTIIDIGGQDNKVIRIDADDNVENFVMNDKCAAGTGRFLEMMARALQISLEDMSTMGLDWHEDITISSMCSVFAESEVVSLVAQNKAVPDIVHGLDKSVAAKINTLVKRVGGQDLFMMTGGVAQNAGVVAAIEEKIGAKLYISDKAQLCGALGAALFALER